MKTFFLILGLAAVFLSWTPQKAFSDSNNSETALDFLISCRLGTRTNLTDSQGKILAVLGTDTSVDMETYIQNQGWLSLDTYIADADTPSTVSVSFGYLTVNQESTLLAEPSSSVTVGILGIVRPGQVFKVQESVQGNRESPLAVFYRIRIRGFLSNPVFTTCKKRNT